MNAPTAEWMRPIIRVPLQQAFPQLNEVKEFKSKICLFNHDRSRVFDVVSPKYQVIEHRDAFQRISTAVNTYFGTKNTLPVNVRSLHGGARIRAEFKIPIKPIKIGRNDVSELTIVMRNSYDRAWAFSALIGAFRLICSNGMMIGENFAGIKGKHVGMLDDAALLVELDLMIARAPMLHDLWSSWQDDKLSHEEAFSLLEGQFPDKYLEPVLVADRFPRSRWDLYNDLTHFATHDTKSIQRRVEFDERIAKLFYADDVEGGGLVTG